MEKAKKIKILYVDDEANNLLSFKATFRFDYQVFTAANAAEAIQVLKQEDDLQVIISDQRMPGTTGVDFFGGVRFTYPKPIRILITGYTDIEDVVSAINKGHIFRYIRKPWIDSDIVSAIEEASKYYIAHSLLSERNDALQKAYNELDKFAYRVTHDLKGPIVNSMAAIEMVKNEPNPEAKLEILNLIEKSMQRLNEFVDNMFDYYKLRLGENNIKEIDFNHLIKEQIEMLGVNLHMHHVRIDYTVDQQMLLKSDELKLTVILSNLLANAIKYQRPENTDKRVRVTVEVAKGRAVIEVSDNGIGIEEQYQKNIFDLFYRATTDEPGNGIGLYNVKDAVLKLNGDITVTSEVGKGTTFKLILPGLM